MKKIILCCCLFLLPLEVQAEKMTILLDWFANPSHAPLFVAQEMGFFKQQGLDVELIGPADPSDPPKLVAAGKADAAITYEPQFMQQVDRGLPLIRIATLIDKPLNCLTVLAKGPIHSIHDLKGQTVGYSGGNVTGMTLKTMLEHNGLTEQDVKRINVHYDLTQALLSHKVAAVTGMMRTYEPIQMQLAGVQARLFLPEKQGVPTYSELIIVINKSTVAANKWPKFLRALQQGEDYLAAHPKAMWLLFAKSHPALNNELNQRAWFASLAYFAKKPAAFKAKDWQSFSQFMYKNGLLSKTYPINQYAINLSNVP